MTAYSATGAGFPEFASIPDSRTEGVRSYREPAEPRPLQIAFLEAAGEAAWVATMRSLLAAGRAAEADALLAADLAGFDGAMARLCKATSAADVLLSGWDDLLPILAEWEGPPITAITLGLTNQRDLVFEAGEAGEPDLLLGLYSDDSFPFSDTSRADLLAECDKDLPAWVDAEEDVEFHLTFSGIAQLNTALINCKHRYFLRDGRDGVEGRAPGGYVEFILASWLLATRFLQAAQRAVSEECLPAGCRLIAGTIGINADFVAILGPEPTFTAASAPRAAPAQPGFATLSMKPWVPREDPTADPPATAQTLRQRINEPVAAAEPRPGLLARLFARLRRG
ncbi:hypothetical protein GCM10009087_06220 [Sphingomonas oligophenolica]|uniref:Uncharacterized protein n=1 Tax=Sphingomonas oligophenolica TaxID=301154 RepID=A0ABU9XX37_9SPHN